MPLLAGGGAYCVSRITGPELIVLYTDTYNNLSVIRRYSMYCTRLIFTVVHLCTVFLQICMKHL